MARDDLYDKEKEEVSSRIATAGAVHNDRYCIELDNSWRILLIGKSALKVDQPSTSAQCQEGD